MSRHNPDHWKHDTVAHSAAGQFGNLAEGQGCAFCDELAYADYEFACPHCGTELFAPWVPCPKCGRND